MTKKYNIPGIVIWGSGFFRREEMNSLIWEMVTASLVEGTIMAALNAVVVVNAVHITPSPLMKMPFLMSKYLT